MPDQIDPFRLSFDKAIAYFKSKLPLPSTSWDTFADEAADFAFTIAGVTKAELLNDVYNLILSALENGDSFQEFKKGFNEAIDKAGWNPAKRPWRTNTIFMTNIFSSYGAGRYKQQTDPEMLKLRPYWQYFHSDSHVPRPAHLALNGKIYPASSDFWKTCVTPNGFNCRCRIFALSQRDLDREGLTVDTPPTERVKIKDKVTGEVKSIPAINGVPIAEPGFTTPPGASKKEDRDRILKQAAQRLPPQLQEQVKRGLKRGK